MTPHTYYQRRRKIYRDAEGGHTIPRRNTTCQQDFCSWERTYPIFSKSSTENCTWAWPSWTGGTEGIPWHLSLWLFESLVQLSLTMAFSVPTTTTPRMDWHEIRKSGATGKSGPKWSTPLHHKSLQCILFISTMYIQCNYSTLLILDNHIQRKW